MVPAGEPTDSTINQLAELLRTWRRGYRRRQTPTFTTTSARALLADKKLHLVVSATSGGQSGSQAGLLPDGRPASWTFSALRTDFQTLAPPTATITSAATARDIT